MANDYSTVSNVINAVTKKWGGLGGITLLRVSIKEFGWHRPSPTLQTATKSD